MQITKCVYDTKVNAFKDPSPEFKIDASTIQISKKEDSIKKASPIFTVVECMPEFPGGDESMFAYLSSNIKYPNFEKDNNISGTVYITFFIDIDGSINDAKVLRGVKDGEGLDKEALRVINAMPNWKAGMQNGGKVRVQYNLPIRFSLRGKK